MTRVKICGITSVADALAAADAGADYAGLNFYPGSPRCVTPAVAAEIASCLPARVTAVGVFVDAPLDHVREVAQQARLRLIQLHGSESAAYCAALGERVIKAFRARAGIETAVSAYRVHAVMLDTAHKVLHGGTGRSFDWTLLERIAHRRIFVAGGVTPSNVSGLVGRYRPFAVDVCSGVESAPGRKDPARMSEFIAAVRSASASGARA